MAFTPCTLASTGFDGGWCQRIKAFAEAGEFLAGQLARGRCRGRGDDAEEAAGEDADDQPVDEDDDEEDDEEEDEGFFVAPQPWNESSHQFALLGSDRIQLLGLDGDQMSGQMHPELRTFLTQNGVEIGESLERLKANHAEVLSLITGTRRSRKSANSILGGEFHLTGDAIFKMQVSRRHAEDQAVRGWWSCCCYE